MAGCCCGGDCETKFIYACSGAANTGLLADQFIMTDFGVEKGKTPITGELIEAIAEQITKKVQA